MDKGLVHLYWGDGKGKTTAAMGLAARAMGQHKRVTVVQFLKSGQSGELASLRRLGAVVFSGKGTTKFASAMTETEKCAARTMHTEALQQALALPCDVLILDEACAAWELDMIDKDLLQQAVLGRPAAREVVMTGRNPAPWMEQAADYSTEMRCHQHPYLQGVQARRGVEF